MCGSRRYDHGNVPQHCFVESLLGFRRIGRDGLWFVLGSFSGKTRIWAYAEKTCCREPAVSGFEVEEPMTVLFESRVKY